MSQGINQTQIQYLMVFLKETPSIGLEEFENKFISSASFEPASSGQTRLYREYFGEDTKIKVLVTGEIELNEKNVFVGLKMAFPEWDFELFPMNIQKLIIKGFDILGTQEAGVVATINPNIKSEKVEWLKPCIFDLSQKDPGMKFDSILEDSFPTQPSVSTSDVPHLEEQLEQFKDIWTRDFYKNEPKSIADEFAEKPTSTEQNIETSLDEIFSDIKGLAEKPIGSSLDEALSDITGLTDEDSDTSFDQIFKEFPSYEPAFHDSYRPPDPEKSLTPIDNLTGVDSEEILEKFGERKSLWPFTNSLEEQTSDSSFMAREPSNRVPSYDMDVSEDTIKEKPFLTQEDPHLSPEINGSKNEFELIGVVGENPAEDIRTLLDTKGTLDDRESILTRYKDRGLELVSNLLNRVKELPTQRIGTILLIFGITSIALSFGVNFIEPDYEASRKAAGVVDLYEWIILNDMLGEETNEVFKAWDDSPESLQFWNWYDNKWSPKISIFNTIKGFLRNAGILFAICGLMVFTANILVNRMPSDALEDDAPIDFGSDKRISLSFTTYNDAWSLIDTWSKEYGFKILEEDGPRRLYRKAGTKSYPPTLCMLAYSDGQVELEAWMTTRIPIKLIPMFSDLGINVLEAKNATVPSEIKEQINSLLLRIGHPPIA